MTNALEGKLLALARLGLLRLVWLSSLARVAVSPAQPATYFLAEAVCVKVVVASAVMLLSGAR